jgi:photosystem II stability/assembly factor-like uncharacterized protein
LLRSGSGREGSKNNKAHQNLRRIGLLAFVLLVLAHASALFAQGTMFTFHGQLTDNGSPANGAYDLEFRLFDQVSGGTQQGSVNAFDDQNIANGLFALTLDFGSDVFDGSQRWLEIAVRPGSSTGPFTALVPRQQITSTPYAIRAAAFEGPVKAAQMTGQLPSEKIQDGAVVTEKIAAAAVTAEKLASGAVGPNQLASGAVTTDAIADGAVTTPKIADGAVTAAKIAPGAVLTNGQSGVSLTGSFSGDGGGLTNVPGTLPSQTVVGTSVQALPNTIYNVSDARQVTVSLPANAGVGDVVRVNGLGAGGWQVVPSPGQTINGFPAGVSWTPRESNRNWVSVASSADASKLVAPVSGGPIYTSSDGGKTWTARDENRGWGSVASSADGSKLVAVVSGGRIYTSTDSGATWTPRENDRSWVSVASSADGSKLVAAAFHGQIYTSTDSGVTWVARDNNNRWAAVASSADGVKLVAVQNDGQMYMSGDSGATWGAQGGDHLWRAVASSADGSKLLAVAPDEPIYASADGGASWTTRESPRNWQSVALSADGNTMIALVYPAGQIFISTDGGASWTARESNRSWVSAASSADGTKLVAVVSGGQIYASVASIVGAQGSNAELEYAGNGIWQPIITAPSLNLAPGSITSDLLAAGAVNTAALADNTVTTTKIATGAVGPNQLANAAVTTAAIADGAVTTPKLADGAVTASKIADGGVTATKIAAGAVGGAQIASGAVGSGQLADGAVGSKQMAPGSVTKQALADGAVTAEKLATISNWVTVTIANPNPATGYWFGDSAAGVGDDRMAIGAPFDATYARNAGAVHLFNTSGVWLTTLTNPTPVADEGFGWAVAGVGNDRVLVGAPTRSDPGSAYLFDLNGTLLTTFTNPLPAAYDQFGYAVAAVGSDRVVIGAYYGDSGTQDGGSAYLFDTNGTLLVTFTNPVPGGFQYFGSTLAAVGNDRVLIGAPNATPTGGEAHLYRTDGTLLATIADPNLDLFGNFGFAVAAVGTDRVLISSIDANGGAGAAYLYTTNGTLLTTFANPHPSGLRDNFGYSVAALGNDRVLIGCPYDATGAVDAGIAYIFSTDGTLLDTFTNPAPASFDDFGLCVATVGNSRVLIGALHAQTTGLAYLYRTETFNPGLTADSVRAGGVTSSSIAQGAVTSDAMQDGSVTEKKMAPDSVTGEKLADGAVTGEKLDSTIGVWTRSGDDVFRLDGKVGIGTGNPQEALDVIGTIKASGPIKATGGLIIENRTSDPPDPVTGQMWLRTDL